MVKSMTKFFNRKTATLRRKLLRRYLPESEKILWSFLQNKKFKGYKFRRQYGVGHYVIDFYCPVAKLAIEIDGSSHTTHDAKLFDKIRQELIEEFGIHFLRFTNQEIKNNLTNV